MNLVGRVVAVAKDRGLRRGVMGSSQRWTVVWLAITAFQLLHRFTARKAVVARFELRPGETIQVTDLG